MVVQVDRKWTVGRILRWAFFLAVVGCIPIILGESSYHMYVATLICIHIITIMGLNLTVGYTGQISLAHAAFMGLGAYAVALTMLNGYSFWLGLLLGVLMTFGAGLLVGLPSLRVKHHYLALVTLGFGTAIYLLLCNEDEITGGFSGLTGIPRPSIFGLPISSDIAYYYLVAGLLVMLTIISLWILNSRWGRAFKAIRENETRAETLGVNPLAYKLLAFAIGAAYAGIAGGLLAPLMRFIDPTSFPPEESFWLLLMLIIGGSGRFEGAFIGPVILTILQESLRGIQQLFFVFFAAIALLLIIFWPSGLAGLLDIFFRKVLKRPPPRLTK